jgi:hypothetical protein
MPSAACRTWVIRNAVYYPSLLKRRPVVEVQMCAAAEVHCGRCPNGGRRRAEEGVAPCPRNGGGTSRSMKQFHSRNAVLAAGVVLRCPCCVGGHQYVGSAFCIGGHLYVVVRSASGVTNMGCAALVAGGDTATSCVYATFILCVRLCVRVCHYVHSLCTHCITTLIAMYCA